MVRRLEEYYLELASQGDIIARLYLHWTGGCFQHLDSFRKQVMNINMCQAIRTDLRACSKTFSLVVDIAIAAYGNMPSLPPKYIFNGLTPLCDGLSKYQEAFVRATVCPLFKLMNLKCNL